MKINFFCILLLFPGWLLRGQDTIFINMQKAVDIALQNYTLNNTICDFTTAGPTVAFVPFLLSSQYVNTYPQFSGRKIFKNENLATLNEARQKLDANFVSFYKKQFELQVKSAYVTWIYYNNKLQNITTRREYVQKYYDAANLKYTLGDIASIEKTKAENAVSEIETAYQSCLIDIDISTITLQKLIMTDDYLLPVTKNFELYMIDKLSDTSDFNGNLLDNFYKAQCEYFNAQIKSLKRKFSPSDNEIANYQETLNKELAQKQRNINSDIEILKLKLDEYFLNLRHYQNYTLPIANSTINNASVAYKLEEIEIGEFIDNVFYALEIKSKYIDLINEYNQTAIQLELYAY